MLCIGYINDLLPLDGACGLRCQIKQNTVDTLYLRGDAGGDVLQQVEGHVLHSGGHGVHSIDGPDDDAPFVSPFVVPHFTRITQIKLANSDKKRPFVSG